MFEVKSLIEKEEEMETVIQDNRDALTDLLCALRKMKCEKVIVVHGN